MSGAVRYSADGSIVPLGRTRKLILRPTQEARRTLGLETNASRESIEHEFWKHRWAARYQANGYEVEIEASRIGGRVDVLARKPRDDSDEPEVEEFSRGSTAANEGGVGQHPGDEVRIGIEIETGKSNVVRNVSNCLRSGFDEVVVVATNEKALEKVERHLAIKGLLVRGRVRVVLRQG